MSTGFLARLAARAGATTTTSLRPDPWRGRFLSTSDAAAEKTAPAAAAGEAQAVAPSVAVVAAPAPPRAPPEATLVATPRLATIRLESPPPMDVPAPESPTVLEAEPVRRAMAPAEPTRADRLPAPLPVGVVRREVVVVTPRLGEAVTKARPIPAQRSLPLAAAQPRPREPRPQAAPEESETENAAIEISIGRIEWRAAAPPPARAPTAPAATGFAAYRALRAGLDRGRR